MRTEDLSNLILFHGCHHHFHLPSLLYNLTVYLRCILWVQIEQGNSFMKKIETRSWSMRNKRTSSFLSLLIGSPSLQVSFKSRLLNLSKTIIFVVVMSKACAKKKKKKKEQNFSLKLIGNLTASHSAYRNQKKKGKKKSKQGNGLCGRERVRNRMMWWWSF